jgi:hypothetical protein
MSALRIKNSIAILFALCLAACSMQGMIETMTSEEDRAMAQQFVADIRSGNSDGLEAVVTPDLWKSSQADFEGAANLFPERPGETNIIAYSMNSDSLGDGARTEKIFTLVTTDDTHWTTTRFTTLQEGGDPLITEWSVEGSSERPADLEAMENVGAVFMWVGITLLLILVGIVVLIVWLVRRSRRKDQERAGIS